MEREVGGCIGMGNTCKPMADSFQCMTKSTTIKKIIIKKKRKKLNKPFRLSNICRYREHDKMRYYKNSASV